MKITIRCKLNPTEKQIKILAKTLSKCLEALNYTAKIAWDNRCYNRVALHHLTYYKVRRKFKLGAQVTNNIRDKVAFSYKTDRKKQHHFILAILPLNFTRTVRLIDLSEVSVSTISGREKIKLQLSDYQRTNLTKAIKFCDSELIERKNKFYLNITIELQDKLPRKTKGIIGVDLGIRNIATLSNGQNFSGQKFQLIEERNFKLRHSLQARNTRSAKRHLKRLSGREKRFRNDFNHRISKQIIELAIKTESAIALENLKNIRKRIKIRKTRRRVLSNWAFFQLQQFINYKAQKEGIPVIFVKPTYTSQTCSSCGNRGSRSGEYFVCPYCGFRADADYNAARNIASRAAFNQPIVASVEVEGSSKEKEQLRPSLVTIF